MIDITFQLNGVDYSGLLSTYKVTHEFEVRDTLTTMDGTEHTAEYRRPSVLFSLQPLTEEQSDDLYDILSGINVSVVYTDPYIGDETSATMRVTTPLESSFGLKSIDGNRYYKGSVITLRQRTVL